jgi:hypothetical protein
MHICTNMLTNTYKYICNCDSLIMCNFWNPLYFVEIGSLLIENKNYVSVFNSSVFLSITPTIAFIHYLICHFHDRYTTDVQSVHIKFRNTSFYHTTHTFF